MSPITGEMLAMTILSALTAPAGLWMLVTAWRRRKGVGPHCAACDYSLEGLPESAGRCPECGADLSRKGAVALGRRRRDIGRAMTGIGLLLPALVLGGLYTAPGVMRAPKRPLLVTTRPFSGNVSTRPYVYIPPPPNPYAGLTDDELAEAILADPPAAQLPVLFSEAISRAKASAPNRSERGNRPDAWVARLVQAGLQRQADLTRDWPVPWATFVESLQFTRQLRGEQWQQYLQQGVRIEGRFRKTVEFGARLPLEFSTTVRVSPTLAQHIKCRMLTLSLGDATTDEVLRYDPQPPDRFRQDPGYGYSFDYAAWRRVKPGENLARLTILVAYVNPNFTNSTSDRLVRIEQPVTVVPRVEKPLKYTPGLDEEFARSLRLSADANSTVADGLRWDGKQLVLTLTCTGSPVDAYCQLSIDVGKTAHIVSPYPRWHKGESGTQRIVCPRGVFEKIGGNPVNVTLIGQAASGVGSVDDTYTWTGTVHYAGVTVIDETAASAPSNDALAATKLQVYRQDDTGHGYIDVVPATRPSSTTQPAAAQ